jgi:spermidine/putrescine-binding protein
MKNRFLAFGCVLGLLAIVVGCTKKSAEPTGAAATASGGKTVNLAIWSNFISQEALDAFKARTGISVNVTH